jgi:hypothetical protein
MGGHYDWLLPVILAGGWLAVGAVGWHRPAGTVAPYHQQHD